jgi:hypothetical protein
MQVFILKYVGDDKKLLCVAEVVAIGGFWIIDMWDDMDSLRTFKSKKDLEKFISQHAEWVDKNIFWDLKFDY